MLGYWDDEDATRQAIDAAGWMHTGDLATVDEEGYVKIVGRIKDMIIRGGENIYPRELEEYLLTVPGVSEAYVIGVPSERYGEEVMAWVKAARRRGAHRGRPRRRLPGPHRDLQDPDATGSSTDSFPMTVTGKIQKFRMRESAIEELGLEQAERVETA